MKLYVGNLAYGATEGDLQDLFGQHGENNVKLITDRDSGRSKGFAFVEFQDAGAAEEAMSKLDGHNFMGRTIRVSVAKAREEGGGGRPPRRNGGGGFRPRG
ncbi:MAG: RNA-binding protein [Bdellovibrionales bacterium]|nr:RNA-binding protein [Bdellovibrionales bacterium]